MIWITKKEHDGKPLFSGFVNNISERETKNGGKIKTFTIGTSEKKQDDSRVYSSWFCTMIGNARKSCGELEKGDRIDVYSFKQSNVSKKNEDGTWGRAFFDMAISDYVKHGNENSNGYAGDDSETPDDENPF